MTEQIEGTPVAGQGDSSSGKLYCYRCASVLDDNSDWCGGCGASQVSTCHKCGTIYRKAEGHCPQCGTRRVRKRHRRRSLKVVLRESVLIWIENHRKIILFTMAGFAIGIGFGAVLKALSEPSMTDGGTADVTSFRYWLDPFIAAGRTIVRGISHAVTDVWNWLFNLVLSHFKTSILGFAGAIAGLLIAIRHERKRRRSRSRHY
jgi:RNA polymerase subunit RPABC4/transcription elongation factor Spt4